MIEESPPLTTHIPINFPIILNGSASFDPDMDILNFQWTIIEQPTASTPMISVPTAAVTSMFTSTPGRYVVELIVDDGMDFSAPDTVVILVFDPGNNTAPFAVTGSHDVTIFASQTAMLTGADSYDVDLDPLSYGWTLISAPPGGDGMLSAPSNSTTDFDATVSGDYQVQLVVNDGMVDSLPEVVSIQVLDNTRPTANVSLSQSAGVQGLPITLDGSRSSDPDSQPLSFLWSITLQPISSNPVIADPTAAATTWSTDTAGSYRVRLVVNDGTLDSPPVRFLADVSAASRPVANVSLSENSGLVGIDVLLNGSRSSDPNSLPLIYLWSVVDKPLGSSVTIADPFAAVTSFQVDMAGEYRLRLIVNNGTEDSAPVRFVVTISETRVAQVVIGLFGDQ